MFKNQQHTVSLCQSKACYWRASKDTHAAYPLETLVSEVFDVLKIVTLNLKTVKPRKKHILCLSRSITITTLILHKPREKGISLQLGENSSDSRPECTNRDKIVDILM